MRRFLVTGTSPIISKFFNIKMPGLAVLLSLFMLTTAVCVPALAQEKLILTTASLPPYHTAEETGFIDELLKAALSRINIEVEIIKQPPERALINANSGNNDGDALRIAGLEKRYPNLIQVPETISEMKFVAYTKEFEFPTNGWKSLNSYSIGIINGWKIYENNVKQAVQITRVKNHSQLFNLLQNGRTQVILYDDWQGLAYLSRNRISGVKKLQPALATRKMYLYLHKKHQLLVSKIASTLRDMKADGTYQQIVDRVLTPLTSIN